MDKVISIINDFKRFEKDDVLKRTFTNGYCYDFAYMLYSNVPNSQIVYIKNKHHYVLKYNNKYYDITGEVMLDKCDEIEFEKE